MTAFDLPIAPRVLVQSELVPIQGTRFQPTGFPDVGAGVYTLPGGKEQLLVESAQSVANRLETACWDESSQDLIDPLRGLSYVRVANEAGETLSASILEAHRLNSAYIEHSDFFESTLKPAIGFDEKRPMDRAKFVAALVRYDVCCLLHGVFLESIAGVLRVPRALSGFIEASGVSRVNTGGVKNDRIQASKDEEGGRTAAEGFGNVPFHRTEFVAETITAYFNLDVEQLRGYRVSPEVQRVLYALALLKIQRFLSTGLRLRTACDFSASPIQVKAPTSMSLPSLDELTAAMPGLIKAAAKHFADPPISVAVFADKKPAEKKPKKAR